MPIYMHPLPESVTRTILKRWRELFGHYGEPVLHHEFREKLAVEEAERWDSFIERLWAEHVARGGRRPWYR